MKARFIQVPLYAAGLFVVLVLTLMVFGLPIGKSLALMVQGSFGDKFGISRTIVKTVPLVLTGLGIVVSWRARMYNIGGEGQFLMGGLLGGAFFKVVGPNLPPALLMMGVVASCTVGGALYGWLAGWLYTRRGVETVISTILLNFIALQLLAWAVTGPLQEPSRALPQSDALPSAAMLPKFNPQMDLNAGVFVALGAMALVTLYLFWTKGGFELQVVGANARVARANRIDSKRVQEQSMLISGALCGLAGGVELTGLAGRLDTSFSQQWGFLAIPVALLGGLHPVYVLLSALYFGALLASSDQLSRFTPAGSTLIYVIQAVAVLGLVGVQSIRMRKLAPPEAV